MLICRRSSNGHGSQAPDPKLRRAGRESRIGGGGPVFLPRRKPSAIAEKLLAETLAEASGGDRVIAVRARE